MTPGPGAPTYRVIADRIEERILRGDLEPGDPVPSTRQITREWGVAMATATKVLAELRSRGAVVTRPGLACTVADTPATTAAVTAPRPATASRLPAPAAPARAPSRRRATHSGTGTATRERIILTAVAIADAEGLTAVSLRRIAVELEVATMTLYRAIASKDDLLVGMMDTLMGDEPWPAVPPRGWRAQLEYVARRQWHGYLAHPWLAEIVSLTRPQLAPQAMRHTEWALRALDGHGLDTATRLSMVLILFGHIRGTAAGLQSEQQAERDTGVDMQEWVRRHEARFAQVIRSGAFPQLAALESEPDIGLDLTDLFELGLAALLDGLAVRIHGTPTQGGTRRRSSPRAYR